VQVRTNAMVTRITPDAVYVGDELYAAQTVFWAAGNEAPSLLKSLGAPLDRAGRVLVRPDLSLPDDDRVFVVGDSAAAPLLDRGGRRLTSGGKPQFVPGLAAAANQMGEHAARMIRRSLARVPRQPFHYRNKGTLAVIGRGRAVADFGRLKLTGRIAFATWLFVHLAYLAGFRNRASVLLEWGYAYFTYRPGARLIGDREGTVGGELTTSN
jgi:NADH dehydrogenase